MINLPYTTSLVTTNVPMHPNQNFPAFQQPQMVTQQMQTSPPSPYSGNLQQDAYKQPLYQFRQSDVFLANHQYVPNILPSRNTYPPIIQPSLNIPPMTQTQPSYEPLPQNLLDPARGYVNHVPPIFILPSGCHQSNHSPVPPPATVQPPALNYPPPIYCPPSFYPFPIPLPIYEQTRSKDPLASCGHCHKRQERGECKTYPPNSCCCSFSEQEQHICAAGNDDTICSKRNCPASVSLQALASQFLSVVGIISCAATRLILRKVPGSNITTTVEDTMEKAQRSMATLTKDQLLTESRSAQHINALINLHMTTNIPANIIPLLTWLQIKVNVLKAQVEALINKKVMECQGYGFEVETSGPVDPAVFASKTNAELRQLLSALRQKETDERVNANFSPYHSQRVMAESRLYKVQAKIRQVEAEFENRRGAAIPATTPTITSRVVRQFAESSCTFGYGQTHLFEPYTPENVFQSPDPFALGPRNPKRLYLKPHVSEPNQSEQRDGNKATCTSEDQKFTDKATGEDKRAPVMVEKKCSTCSCDESSSDDEVSEGKKKLRVRIDERGNLRIHGVDGSRIAEILKEIPSPVSVVIEKLFRFEGIDSSDSSGIQKSTEICDEAECSKDLSEKETHLDFDLAEQLPATQSNQKDSECDGSKCTQLTHVESESESPEYIIKEVIISEVVSSTQGIESEQESLNSECSKIEETSQNLIASKGKPENVENLKITDVCKLKVSQCNQSRSIEIESKSLTSNDVTGETTLSENLPEEYKNKDTHPENVESQKENVQIVSILTSILTNFEKCISSEDMKKNKTENHEFLSSNEINSSIAKSATTSMDNEEFQEINRNATLEKMFGEKPNSLKEGRQNGKVEDGGAPGSSISKDILHQKEIESDSSRIVYDGNASYHRDTDTGNGIVSTIYSVIESRLVSFGSLLSLGKIPNSQIFFPSSRFDEKSRGNENRVITIDEKVRDAKLNKQMSSRDWILPPDDNDGNIFGNCVSVKETCNSARKLRQSIIVDRKNREYVLIGGSISGQSRILSKMGLDQPCQVHRSLLIRSRLKNPRNSERECPRPFTILNRAENDKVFTSEIREKENEIKNNENIDNIVIKEAENKIVMGVSQNRQKSDNVDMNVYN